MKFLEPNPLKREYDDRAYSKVYSAYFKKKDAEYVALYVPEEPRIIAIPYMINEEGFPYEPAFSYSDYCAYREYLRSDLSTRVETSQIYRVINNLQAIAEYYDFGSSYGENYRYKFYGNGFEQQCINPKTASNFYESYEIEKSRPLGDVMREIAIERASSLTEGE